MTIPASRWSPTSLFVRAFINVLRCLMRQSFKRGLTLCGESNFIEVLIRLAKGGLSSSELLLGELFTNPLTLFIFFHALNVLEAWSWQFMPLILLSIVMFGASILSATPIDRLRVQVLPAADRAG